MKKSKRQRQIDKLKKLLKVLGDNLVGRNYDPVKWTRRKISEVEGGDIDLDSGGLSKEDMIRANKLWAEHNWLYSSVQTRTKGII